MSKPFIDIGSANEPLTPQFAAQVTFFRNNGKGKRSDRSSVLNLMPLRADEDTQEILEALNAKDYKGACKKIRACKNTAQARLIFSEILNKSSSQCRYAFLCNTILRDELTSHDLHLLLNKNEEWFEITKPDSKRYRFLEKIGLIIAKDETLARRFGLRDLLRYIEYNKPLAKYIANNEKFLMSLDPGATLELFTDHPELRLDIIHSLSDAFQKYPVKSRENLLVSQTLDKLEAQQDKEKLTQKIKYNP